MASRNEAPSRKSLKSQITLPLTLFFFSNIAVLLLEQRADGISASGIFHLVLEWQTLIPVGGAALIVTLLSGLLSSKTKDRLVFWRWRHPLPGSFAFSRYATQDSRISIERLKEKIGKFPRAPRNQNALWYSIFKSLGDNVAVAEAHKRFLVTRDITAFAFLFLIVAAPIGFYKISSFSAAAAYAGYLLLQYLLTRWTASNYGVRLVTTVLAIKSAS